MTEASIGKTETQELAVMVDTFHPLHLTKQAAEMEKPYMETWLEGDGE
jgi:homogentisate 1,2-dioxygenase